MLFVLCRNQKYEGPSPTNYSNQKYGGTSPAAYLDKKYGGRLPAAYSNKNMKGLRLLIDQAQHIKYAAICNATSC